MNGQWWHKQAQQFDRPFTNNALAIFPPALTAHLGPAQSLCYAGLYAQAYEQAQQQVLQCQHRQPQNPSLN